MIIGTRCSKIYFLKRNITTIAIFTLLFGGLGTMIGAFTITKTYDYEGYYILSVEPTERQVIELEERLTTEVETSKHSFAVKQQSNPNRVKLNIDRATLEVLTTVKMDFESIMKDQHISYEHADGGSLEQNDKTLFRAFIILGFLLTGLLIGLFISFGNRKISTDEETEHYLGQKTLGTF